MITSDIDRGNASNCSVPSDNFSVLFLAESSLTWSDTRQQMLDTCSVCVSVSVSVSAVLANRLDCAHTHDYACSVSDTCMVMVYNKYI